ncbi:glycosyltransferase family 2 protein [Luteibaculum oceani]|uniref:Glycosyltransferase family 2 protein n=1 Tax=Luteibaculum oceani TaxID=1294296 RepID=A0A5C6V875_9FLAO|nr:glycosyltransferase family 2 protein [Luteibaculum oceani]TXC81533.1 glycosyltransferase family 2 protein [Luteibaculum oceani]
MIYLLLPAYNEELSLPKLLPKIKTELQKHQLDYRMVVVNDGSTDSTAEILEDFANDPSNQLTVLTHPINRGLGETERDGFEYIASICDDEDVIIRVEGDDTHDPKYIVDIYNKILEGYDVVNTSRFQPGGDQKGLNTYRKTISKAANMFMKFMFNIKGVKDYSCGFRGYRAPVIKDSIRIFGNNFVQLRGLGFTATLEVIVKLNILGCRFAEVPFVLRYDMKESESKMVSSITTLGYFTMAILYHWPFGGWKRQYKGLNKLYRSDREKACEEFNLGALKTKTASKISI